MQDTAAPTPGHRRNKSAAVFKSIISSKGHKRAPSDGVALTRKQPLADAPYLPASHFQTPLLPPDHPDSQLRSTARSENIPIGLASPRKSPDSQSASPKKSLHKKTLSSVSLRSLAKKQDKPKDKEKESSDARRARKEEEAANKPKKTKSSTNLATMFGKGKSKDRGQSPVKQAKDKENTTPPTSTTTYHPPQTPIWAEFSSRNDVTTTSKVPLNDQRRSLEDEIALYTPREYSPAKQRDFSEYGGQPSLQKRPAAKERPKSMGAPKTTSTASLLETFSRKKTSDRVPLSDTKGNEGRQRDSSPTKITSSRPMFGRSASDTSSKDPHLTPVPPPATTSKKQSRVMAAVAAFNGKAKQAEAVPVSPTKLDPKVVDAEFEAVLESRNIPTHQRGQMRTLKLEVKADFVRMHKLDTPQTSRATSSHSSINEATNPAPARSSKSRNGSVEEESVSNQTDKSANSTKRERPRSRTFNFSRSDSPTKKQKGEGGDRKTSSKPQSIPRCPSSRSLASNASDRSVSNGAKAVKADEFISYLKKTPKPQEVEIGKLHKLRLLLRNETVDWVDNFIQEGGMTELVGLLHRIMEIEWREDHEDTLLHELLRCLKGLCTTATALKQLKEISSTLYPALLAMLFDEEHKGPSEFTTRELIIEIIFAHISMAPEDELESRASELARYLKDPVKEKETSTVPFILQMHTSRPYQVWCKELSNVTKEVFWIFIHNLNVIPLPRPSSSSSSEPPKSYAKTHFPGQRAIVPAAPYVGGVEWDATNYLATHIDLLNGIIASLPTASARNQLRHELQISGFEKVMGVIRACNPKYYGAVHDSVKVWVGAALADDWDVRTVRMGAGDGKGGLSPVKQSPTKKVEPPPQLQAPKMDLALGLGFEKDIAIGNVGVKDDDWF
ncbi:similar to GTPase binding protein Rid1 [Plenodomus lingam JN3]|uniref:Similar to GTPase binding protein Rid1 n=2 Tax=Leptosphaeria maculans TaxID=5022 RepID=E4ZSJ1_LEPMJ|nr:similar to GTPase binding protein Rid1 [Plenodomus lingam JN3]CBX94371.1 similar to GTPase binding protein Rid1 [Plenodomus lingam JN3]